MRFGTIAVVGLLVAVSAAQAQRSQFEARRTRLELRPFAGMYVPQGTQSQDFKSAATYGFQTALEFTSFAHVLASAGYTDGRSKIGALISPKTQMWQYDVGAEFNALHELGSQFQLRPFVGFGAGVRSYKYEDKGISTKSSAAGYASLGSELQRGFVAVRLEGRGYLTHFNEPLNTQKFYRNDMYVMFGLALHLN